MTAYYNEIEPFAADWLLNLISIGLIPPGEVDTRSIKDVSADDVRGFNQCHFFAGVGGWSQALRLAGWPDDCPVWTGSCPCQPFSTAGKRKGTDDERHLWPEFRRLIAECSPSVVFGEQVASKDGRGWLSRVRADLEALGYGVGAADLCAAGMGAPHIRQRLWWVADRDSERFSVGSQQDSEAIKSEQHASRRLDTGRRGVASRLGIATSKRDRAPTDAGSDCEGEREGRQRGIGGSSASGRMDNTECDGQRSRRHDDREDDGQQFNAVSELGDSESSRRLWSEHTGASSKEEGSGPRLFGVGGSSEASWSDFSIIPCLDGKNRRVEPSSFPLVDGIPTKQADPRMGFLLAELGAMGHDPKTARKILRQARHGRTGRLKGYGNAIVPQVAAEFIAAFLETQNTDEPAAF